jgi:hypothetical protein
MTVDPNPPLSRPSAGQFGAGNVRFWGERGHFADAAVKRTATWVSIKDMAMCRSWPALLLFVRLYAIVQDVRLPTR